MTKLTTDAEMAEYYKNLTADQIVDFYTNNPPYPKENPEPVFHVAAELDARTGRLQNSLQKIGNIIDFIEPLKGKTIKVKGFKFSKEVSEYELGDMVVARLDYEEVE